MPSQKNNPINNRISAIIKAERLSEITFSTSIGKSSSFFNTAKKKGSYISADVLSKIIEVYPKYSMRWILTGEGSMIARSPQEINYLKEPLSKYGEVDLFKEVLIRYLGDEEVKLEIRKALI